MPKATIRLAYRQIIDHQSVTPFEQKLFYATYSEFCVQQQSFSKGRELYTWESIRHHFPKSDPALPFKVSFAIAGLIGSLQNKIPDLHDALGNNNISFVQHRFGLISSDCREPTQHVISITYITDEFTLFEIIGDQLLLSQQPPQAFQLKMQPGLSVISYIPLEERSRQPVAAMASL